jgi:HK97 family phage prohead protease/HK97 family phage major capsid protein
MPEKREYKSLRISELKAEKRDESLYIKGYGAYFGNVDSYGDVINPGAFASFLQMEDAKRIKLCWQHDLSEVIGVITNIYEDEKGLFFEAKISNTQRGKDAAALLEDGAIDEFSIGYRVIDAEPMDGDLRLLKSIYLYEISLVSRAANPMARLLDKEKKEENNDNTIINHNQNHSTMEELMKKLQEDLAKESAARVELEKKLQEMKEGKDAEIMQTSIDNLDKSIKDLEGKIEEMKKKEQEVMNFATSLDAALIQSKSDIEAMMKKNDGRISLKFATSDVTNHSFGVQQNANVDAAAILPYAFLTNLPRVQRTGTKVAWLEGNETDNTGYIAEIASGTESTFAVTEKQRNFAKIGTFLKISSELQSFLPLVADWAKNYAYGKLQAKADNLVFTGAGADGTKPSEVYGIKASATVFSALGTYNNANVADVILDAVSQAAKNGYIANLAFVSYKQLAALRGLKDTTGNYIYNQANGMLGQVKVVPSVALADAEVLVLDSSCVTLYEGNQYELEVSRIAAEDAWGVYLRKSIQVVIGAAAKKGVIYVADVATAIGAITA